MEKHASMTWARRLKRVFYIGISECQKCKAPVRIIACIEDPVIIRKILDHLKAKAGSQEPPSTLPLTPAPPLLLEWDQGLTEK